MGKRTAWNASQTPEMARKAVLEKFRSEIKLGLDQAKRGELLDGEEIFEELERSDRSR
jgi:predicted transcriptional regulator